MRIARLIIARGVVMATGIVLAGCVYVPRTVEVYDADCQITARQMTLELQQVGYIAGCSNESCVALVLGAGAVGAVTAVVSGSIVVAGNVVHWLEKQGRCVR